jgi:hypothetical protein
MNPTSIENLNPEDFVMIHISKNEMKNLTRLNGGMELIEGFPAFTKLGALAEDPQTAQAITNTLVSIPNLNEQEIERAHQESIHVMDSLFGKAPNMEGIDKVTSEEADKLGEMGINGDTEIVVLPTQFFNLLWSNVPEEMKEINPKDGLPMFGIWDMFLSLVGGVVGTIIAPGIGTAIGMGLGNFGGSYIDEIGVPEEEKTSFLEKLGGGLFAGALGYVGGQFFGAPAGGGLEAAKTALAGTAGYVGAGGALAKGYGESNRLQNQNMKTFQRYNDQVESQYPTWDSVMPQQEGQNPQNPNQPRFSYSGMPQQNAATPSSYGSMNDIFSRDSKKMPEPEKTNYMDVLEKYLPKEARARFKDGGKVRELAPITKSQYIHGSEKGQDDNVYVDVPKNSFVLDAATVAALGDGNSLAGKEVLDDWVSKIYDKINIKRKIKKEAVPCALSPGEYSIDDDVVFYMGRGNMNLGHKTLEKLVKKIRKHKGHIVNSIPPAAHSIEKYLKGI